MSKYLVILIACLLFASCDSSYQVDVYLQNNSSENITVTIKKNDTDETTVSLAPNEKKRVVSSSNIPIKEDNKLGSAAFKALVASNITCSNSKNQLSKLNWKSDAVTFEHTDIGQVEYLMNIEDHHFE